jgi:2-phosphosulfolactate phosphatase
VQSNANHPSDFKDKRPMPLIQLQVALLPSLVDTSTGDNQGCVVIDTLRFTTTACQALASGCHSIRVVGSLEQARSLHRQDSGAPASLLCGERHCRPIDGFHLGNSPLEFIPSVVGGRSLIFSTTNGTTAVQSAGCFAHCLLGCLVNRASVANLMVKMGIGHWYLLCAGTDGSVAGEDVLAAGAIIDGLRGTIGHDLQLVGDSARLALSLWKQASCYTAGWQSLLETYAGGQNLIEAGFRNDIAFASQLDRLDCVPVRQTSEPASIFALDAGGASTP